MSRLVNALKKAQEPEVPEADAQELDPAAEETGLVSGADSFDGYLELDIEDDALTQVDAADEAPAESLESLELDLEAIDGATDDATVDTIELKASQSIEEQEAASTNLYQKILQDDIDNLLSEPDPNEESTPVSDDQNDSQPTLDSVSEPEKDPVDSLVSAAEFDQSAEGDQAEAVSTADHAASTLSIAERFARQQDRARSKKQKIQWTLAGLSALGLASAATFFYAQYAQNANVDTPAAVASEQFDDSVVGIDASIGEAATDSESTADRGTGEDLVSEAKSPSRENNLAETSPASIGNRDEPPAVSSPNKAAVAATAADAPSAGVSFERTRVKTSLSSLLQQAYAAYSVKDYELAASFYNRALDQDADNVQALNGLGSVAFKRNQFNAASDHFHDARNADGSNAYALLMLQKIAALGATEEQSDVLSVRGEGFVSTRAADYSAMGYSLAASGDWAEAQSMFFQAVSLAPENPGHLYHLAISLDQLNKHELALTYYQQAIAFAKLDGLDSAPFDLAAAGLRVEQLKTAQLSEQ